MQFEDFLRKLGEGYNPDAAYKIYLNIQISLIKEIITTNNLISNESLKRVETNILNQIAEKLKNK